MVNYRYHLIGKLAKRLKIAEIDNEIIDQIMEGGKEIRKKPSLEEKTDWFRGAMAKMDKLLDIETRKTVREGCACYLGGQQARAAKKIAQECESLEERIKAVNDLKYICGSVTMKPNGDIIACGDTHTRYFRKCVCLPEAKAPLSITYCYCCGGHVKHHLQTALGRKLDGTVIASSLSSGGKKPCTFRFRIME
jgi:hypothetical protein